MKLTKTMTAGELKAYVAERGNVCALEAYKAHCILSDGGNATVTVFIRDDVRNHRNPDNERYTLMFDVTGGEMDALVSAAKAEIDTHFGQCRRAG